MRIIAGTARSLPLKTVEGLDTRPTTDRIKETLFNIIQDEIPGCYFLDLFAGSGQMGLEAVSRGAQYAVFVENNKKAAACVEDNIRFTKFTKETKLYNENNEEVGTVGKDVELSLNKENISEDTKYFKVITFDIIFMDPPYKQEFEYDVLSYLKDSSLLKENGIIIVEASLDTAFDYLPDMGFTLKRLKTYKTNEHAFIIKNQ